MRTNLVIKYEMYHSYHFYNLRFLEFMIFLNNLYSYLNSIRPNISIIYANKVLFIQRVFTFVSNVNISGIILLHTNDSTLRTIS